MTAPQQTMGVAEDGVEEDGVADDVVAGNGVSGDGASDKSANCNVADAMEVATNNGIKARPAEQPITVVAIVTIFPHVHVHEPTTPHPKSNVEIIVGASMLDLLGTVVKTVHDVDALPTACNVAISKPCLLAEYSGNWSLDILLAGSPSPWQWLVPSSMVFTSTFPLTLPCRGGCPQFLMRRKYIVVIRAKPCQPTLA